MNQSVPTSAPDQTAYRKAARRNYLMFCGVTGFMLFVVVLIGSLFVLD